MALFVVAGLGLQDQLKGYAVSKLYRVGLCSSARKVCVFLEGKAWVRLSCLLEGDVRELWECQGLQKYLPVTAQPVFPSPSRSVPTSDSLAYCSNHGSTNADAILSRIPGRLNDRRTPLGELNWIFTAITDTIAWNVLPRGERHHHQSVSLVPSNEEAYRH